MRPVHKRALDSNEISVVIRTSRQPLRGHGPGDDDHEPVIVTRAKGKPVVMVSLEDWASMDETTYLLSSPANARRLRDSITQLNEGKGVARDLIEE